MFGFSINFSIAKIEVSISVRGAGSKAIRHTLAIAGGAIDVVHKHGCIKFLTGSSYKHVGTIFSPDCKPELDVALKCGIMRQECRRFNS